MKQRFQLAFCAALAALSLSAQAGSGVQASEIPRITNGGTGVHTLGVASMPGHPYGVPAHGVAQAGTMANGTANAQPHTMQRAPAQAQVMGNASWNYGVGPAPARHPSWGTPD